MTRQWTPSARWRIAQQYQLDYQLAKAGHLKSWDRYKSGYVRRSHEVVKELTPFLSLAPASRILEVGSGPTGLIFFLPEGKRFALDPLAHHLHEPFGTIRGRDTRAIQGIGEHLPFPGGTFDAVILYNTVDHTDDPSAVLRESRRVLKNTGVLCLGVNIYPLSLRAGSRLYEAISSVSVRIFGVLLPPPIFRAHPRMFGADAIRDLLVREGFIPLKERTVDPQEARRLFRRRRTGVLWRLISIFAYTGGFYLAFCRKR